MKIFERVLDKRIRQVVMITPNQCGFVKGRGTTDAIHAVWLLMEKHREKNKTVHMVFLDLEKAFDPVPHELIWRSLHSHGVPEAYVRLLYADDIGLSETGDCLALQTQTQAWKDRLDENGMRLNIKKTEHLECGPQTDGTISVDGQPLNKVNHFKYLGSVVTSDCDTLSDRRQSKDQRSMDEVAAECWPATTKHEQAMNTMEMKMLRWPLGLTHLDRLTNEHIRKRWGVAPITDKMRKSRLRWYGHVVRSEEESVARRALRMDPGGNRPRGRPKKRWTDTVAQDMKTINVSSEDALDRKKWKKACQKVDPAPSGT
ncbi:hypothetical protein SRHO_G00299800 [Serrasalmus rhombeus]